MREAGWWRQQHRDAMGRWKSTEFTRFMNSNMHLVPQSTQYAKGTGSARWRALGRGAHRVGWDIRWDILPDDPRLAFAAARAANKMMRRAVSHAKKNHGGWSNRSGRAERSIRVIHSATARNPAGGQWGSDGSVDYFLFLELKYATLRAAADATVNMARLAQDLRAELVKSGWGVRRGAASFRGAGMPLSRLA